MMKIYVVFLFLIITFYCNAEIGIKFWKNFNFGDSIEEVKNKINNEFSKNNNDIKIYEDLWDKKDKYFRINASTIDLKSENFKKIDSFIFSKDDKIINITIYFYQNRLVSLYIYGNMIENEILDNKKDLNKNYGSLILKEKANREAIIKYLNTKYTNVNEKLINEYFEKLTYYYYFNTPKDQIICFLEFYPDYLHGIDKKTTICLFIDLDFAKLIKWDFLPYL